MADLDDIKSLFAAIGVDDAGYRDIAREEFGHKPFARRPEPQPPAFTGQAPAKGAATTAAAAAAAVPAADAPKTVRPPVLGSPGSAAGALAQFVAPRQTREPAPAQTDWTARTARIQPACLRQAASDRAASDGAPPLAQRLPAWPAESRARSDDGARLQDVFNRLLQSPATQPSSDLSLLQRLNRL